MILDYQAIAGRMIASTGLDQEVVKGVVTPFVGVGEKLVEFADNIVDKCDLHTTENITKLLLPGVQPGAVAEVSPFPEALESIPHTTLSSLTEVTSRANEKFSQLDPSGPEADSSGVAEITQNLERFDLLVMLLSDFQSINDTIRERAVSHPTLPYIPCFPAGS